MSKEARELLKEAKGVMNYLGDILNNHDMVEPQDELRVNKVFKDIDAYLALNEPESVCKWHLNNANGDDDDYWETDCGSTWFFVDGTPKNNGVKYCHSCGKKVKYVQR